MWLAAALLAGCPEPDAGRVFARDVVPVLERSCAASVCHGVTPGAEERGEVIDWSLLFFEVDENGRLTDLDAARRSALRAAVTEEDPAFSSLLRKPLAETYGGLPHHGGDNLLTPDAPEYRALYDWLLLETGGGEDEPPLDALEQQFADTVQPALIGMGCATGSCHGLSSAIPLRLDPGVDGAFSRAITRENRRVASTMLALDGEPDQTRLLRKALPLHRGGILHKGGAETFLTGPDDPRAEAIRAWACSERTARIGAACDAPVTGIVFVRGPLAPEPVFDLDAWNPGSDLWWATLDDALGVVSLVNLTAPLHAAPADVRDPSVTPDGRSVTFAMRTSAAEGHRLWTLDLASGAARPLTEAAAWSDRDPTEGPGGLVWFVSTRAGVVADGGGLDADLYTVDPASGHVERRSYTPHVERKPAPFTVGDEAGGELSFTALRAVVPEQARAHSFRFPDGLETEYHQHFGITPPETLFYDQRELPDGRYVTTIGALDGPWGGVRLGIVDRNFGPELQPGTASSLPFYGDPLVRLDPTATASGVTGALYRDPAPLPDGRILAAYAPGPIDLDAAGALDTAIVVLSLAEAPDGSGPVLSDRVVVLDAPGLADHDPEPVFVRTEPRDPGTWSWDRTASTGTLRHQGVAMIDAVLANLPPSGLKQPRRDIVGVRLVEALAVGPEVRAPLPQAGPGATTTSLTPYGPARVLAELPLAADGSFYAEIPARIAFRIQPLDADGMAVGYPHNRWFDVSPGQTIRQGVPDVDAYASLCAGCHGAADGRPEHAFVAPDVMTTASITLSAHAGGDPRRPLPAAPCDDATRVEVDFARHVQPVLDRACVACHADLAAAPGAFFPAPYERLVGHVSPGSARQSALIERLTGRELDAPGSPDGGPHAPLAAEDLRTLVRWIDLGASFVGTAP